MSFHPSLQECRAVCDNDDEEVLPAPPNALLHVSPGRLVEDVDQEIFLLYTLNAKSEHDGGLGYVNHSADKIFISIDRNTWSSSTSERNLSGKLITPIYQHVTSLRSSKGNTGSVVWRSTVELAIRFRSGALFDPCLFNDATVLELGAGTGALPALVADLSGKWLATDQDELLPLLRKNLSQHERVKTASLDWFDFLNPPSMRSAQLRKKHVLDQLLPSATTTEHQEKLKRVDLIICCDCIYNPALFDALIATLNVFTDSQRTIVLISCEMRSNESLAEFLTRWKQSHLAWIIVSLEHRFDKGFVALAAWKQ
ncbi:hypothetical protein NDA18_004306 [Ustilago nuda]|nr:hypothetical protein NDA18_004306 [Ustilago nuda]